MNQQQTSRGPSFYVGLIRGTLVYNYSLSPFWMDSQQFDKDFLFIYPSLGQSQRPPLQFTTIRGSDTTGTFLKHHILSKVEWNPLQNMSLWETLRVKLIGMHSWTQLSKLSNSKKHQLGGPERLFKEKIIFIFISWYLLHLNSNSGNMKWPSLRFISIANHVRQCPIWFNGQNCVRELVGPPHTSDPGDLIRDQKLNFYKEPKIYVFIFCQGS